MSDAHIAALARKAEAARQAWLAARKAFDEHRNHRPTGEADFTQPSTRVVYNRRCQACRRWGAAKGALTKAIQREQQP